MYISISSIFIPIPISTSTSKSLYLYLHNSMSVSVCLYACTYIYIYICRGVLGIWDYNIGSEHVVPGALQALQELQAWVARLPTFVVNIVRLSEVPKTM